MLRHDRLRKRILRCRSTGARRSGLRNPADGILDEFRRHPRVAVLGVRLDRDSDIHHLYAYIVEPAFRFGCTLLIGADIGEQRLAAGVAPAEPFWGYDWSGERLLHLLRLGRSPTSVEVPESVPRWRRWLSRLSRSGDVGDDRERLDRQQMAAVRAGDGVVQIIAPAGSGKTTVLVRRVLELRDRGAPPESILCMSFNRNAKLEMAERLEKAGLSGVVVRSFHGMGREILAREGRLRSTLGELPEPVLQTLLDRITPAADAPAASLSCAQARNLISGFKLADMVPPEQAGHPLYTAYEDELRRRDQLDFDDLIARSVRLLQDDANVRRRWQARFQRVLVDEYQDIEPAQALLVGILAAPQDSLFCVGDEDQCIYAWRRAAVERIIELDQVYPGLERHALQRNYRCGRRITQASRRLVQHNRVRFRKPLLAGSADRGSITAFSTCDRSAGARWTARALKGSEPGTTAVLARTDRLLQEVRAACERGGVPLEGLDLATIHGAKGREWPRVILYGVDEGLAPHAASLKTGGLEAERRLFYVALTRARERLEIVCTRGRESRFLGEAGIRVLSAGPAR
ncbi:MAG TPA: ATP-dependent helicase [Candidatus Krumholzibacteria bacterium]|nr:ATP-dependent helicase [Candidatus Krumholzibacteria bacterium]HRX52584.1 ATP-dependent helicase [Candidatus Krumholzibacteria bacterium]